MSLFESPDVAVATHLNVSSKVALSPLMLSSSGPEVSLHDSDFSGRQAERGCRGVQGVQAHHSRLTVKFLVKGSRSRTSSVEHKV